jgi:hypothetical protein
MYNLYTNPRYFWKNNAEHKEIHSQDEQTFIKGGHGNWEVHVKSVHIASFFLRKWAREFIREKKKS